MASYSNSRDYDAAKTRRLAAIGLDANGNKLAKSQADFDREATKAAKEVERAKNDKHSQAYLALRQSGQEPDAANDHCYYEMDFSDRDCAAFREEAATMKNILAELVAKYSA